MTHRHRSSWWLAGLFAALSLFSVQAQQAVEADFVGTIDNETPFIEFPLRVPITGSTVTIDMAATSGDLDTLLYLVDDKGSIVAQNDDRLLGGGQTAPDSLLVFPQAAAGQYRIIATRFKVVEGESSGDFRILIDIEEPQPSAAFGTRRGDLLNTGFPIDLEARPEARWTVLAYYGGDNNLEAGILHDLKEFEMGGGSTENAHIVVMVDRSPEFATDDGDWSGTRIYQITAATNSLGDPIIIDSEPLVEFERDTDGENLDLSEGEIFAQFLVWGVQTFPAEDYVVAFASHGDGWKGITADDTPTRREAVEGPTQKAPEFALLNLPELTQAFELGLEAAGVEEFALLINDACLMGSVEYFAAIAPYFRYTLASPEIVVNPALDMSELVAFLNSSESGDIQALGKRLVDRYMDVDVPARGASDTVYLTSALFDLRAFREVTEAIENFAAVVNQNPVVRGQELGKVRRNVYTYTAFSGFTDKIDLGDLMSDLIAQTNDDEIITAAERVIEALDAARVYGRSGAAVEGVTSFYNIYFPEDVNEFSGAYFDETSLKEWSRLLRNYYNSFTPQYWTGGGRELSFHAPVSPNLKITLIPTETVSILDRPHISYEIVGRNIAKGQLTVDRILEDGTSVRVSTEALVEEVLDENGNLVRVNNWSDGVTPYSAFWRAHLPVITDGVNSAPELMNFTERVVYLDGQYREAGSETWNDVTVSFDVQTRQFQRVINRSQSGSGVAVVEIPVGAEFRAFRSLVSADGAITREPSTNIYIWPTGGLTWDYRPAPNGDYNIGIEVSAFGGTSSFETARVTVNNDGLPPELRGDTNTFGGYIVPLNVRWSPLSFSGSDFLFRSFSPDEKEVATVYLSFGLENPSLEQIGEAIISDYGLTRSSDYSAVTVDGENLLQFDFTRSSGDETFIGRMFIYYNVGARGAGQGFAAEVKSSESDASARLEALYQQILGTQFFDAGAYRAARTDEWSILYLNEEGNIFTSIRQDWETVETETGEGWLRFEDPSNDGVFIETGTLNIASQVAGGSNVLSNLVAGRLVTDIPDLVITGNQIYYGENVQWEAALYEGTRGDVAVTGRVYVTLFEEQVYVVWVEAPQGDLALQVFPNTFEVFVDTYRLFPSES